MYLLLFHHSKSCRYVSPYDRCFRQSGGGRVRIRCMPSVSYDVAVNNLRRVNCWAKPALCPETALALRPPRVVCPVGVVLVYWLCGTANDKCLHRRGDANAVRHGYGHGHGNPKKRLRCRAHVSLTHVKIERLAAPCRKKIPWLSMDGT